MSKESRELEGYILKSDVNIPGKNIKNMNVNGMNIQNLIKKNIPNEEGRLEVEIIDEEQREALKVFFPEISKEIVEIVDSIEMIIIGGNITSFELKSKGRVLGKEENIIHSYKYVNDNGNIFPELRGIYKNGEKSEKLERIGEGTYKIITRGIKEYKER